MKKIILLMGFLASSVLYASEVIVEMPVYHKYDLSVGIPITIPIGSVELRVLDMGDPVASVFKLTVVRIDPNGQIITLCENQIIVPFSSEASLFFYSLGVKIKFNWRSFPPPATIITSVLCSTQA